MYGSSMPNEIREPKDICSAYRAGDDSVSSDDYGSESDADSGEADN